MADSHEELTQMVDTLERLAGRGRQEDIQQPLDGLKQAAEQIGMAWSGSWMGYHANVYYQNLQPPPPGAHFTPEWGGLPTLFIRGTSGEWVEFNPGDVQSAIYEMAGNPDIGPARLYNEEACSVFREQRGNLLSILEVLLADAESTVLVQMQDAIESLAVHNEGQVVQLLRPKQSVSRDSLAVYQGIRTPPHIAVLSEVLAIQNTVGIITKLANLTRQITSHTLRQRRLSQPIPSVGTRVFIGHGHSLIWRELKDFLEVRLCLLVDEYKRVSTAGITTTSRLSAMMDSAGIAFLVMTGEDEQTDGKARARENVVHEVGLFQGRLGFERTIVLLEDSCQQFSNIMGLGQIRFPKGNIEAAFEEIRKVLEREGLLQPGASP